MSIAFKLAGEVDEGIGFIDPNDKYCTVEVSAPNLIPILAGAIALYQSGNIIGDALAGPEAYADMTTPVGRKIEGVAILVALQVLGSVANYQYEIWGRPVGYVRRSIQGVANDVELQNELGKIIEEKIKTIYTNTIYNCTEAANIAMMFRKFERNKVSFDKTMHLQDEDGDVLKIKHPFGENYLTIVVSKLTRTINFGKNGSCIDSIEGWVVQ
jgi:hypothetical protein